MADDIRQSQMGEVQLQICGLVQEAMTTHGNTIALAAWNRSFAVMYDAAYYLPKATGDA